MIWILMFFLIFILTMKNFFFNFNFELLEENLFMISLIPLVAWFIFNFNFSIEILENFLYNFILLFLSLCFITINTLMFLMFFESCVLLMMFLIFNLSKEWDKISSMIFMFFLNFLGSVPFMIFCLSIKEMFFLSIKVFNNSFFFFSMIFILLSKMPVFFMHFWLTKAHVSASGSCSMILASLLLKVGTMGLFKFSPLVFSKTNIIKEILMSFSVWISLILSLIIVRFLDLKYLVACSSVFHMSLILPGFLLMNIYGSLGSLMMTVGHGLVSLFLFFLITLIYEMSLNRSFDFNKSLESFSKIMGMIMFFSFLMNLGFPPFLNFFSELYLYKMVLNFSNFNLITMMMVLMTSSIILMLLMLKILIGKKILIFYLNENVKLNIEFKMIFIILFFLSFLI